MHSAQVQLVEEDKYAFVSSRQTDGIVRVHVATGDVVYTIGGEYGDFEIFDADGRKWKKGTSLWVGQHNAEYFGDDEFCLFDNQEASASSTLNASRLLCLRLDEAEGTATVTFEKVLDSYTPHFGDNDRLPSGNQLGVSWPKTFSTDDQYDVRAIEVVRSSAGQQKRAKFPTSKAHISAVFHSFRLMFGRAIISRNGLEARMLSPERARAEHSR